MTKIKELPKSFLPREKLFTKGPQALKDYELLAILLRTGYKGQNVLDLARRILKSKSLIDLAIMKPQEISKIKGVGKSRGATITASLEIATRIFKNDTTIKITTPEDVLKVVGDIRNKKKEHFVAIYLDARNQLIATEIISIGTLNASIVHPRDVFASAIKYNAASIIVAHNHPSGDPESSKEDIMITEKLVNAGKILGIAVIDHLIVTKDNYFSFKETKNI